MSSIREIALAKAVGGNGGGGGIAVAANAGAHNSIYRGEYLGDAVTSAQYDAIDAGTFDDLFIGDYWTINGVNWRIAAFDYWYGFGNLKCVTHHLVIVPDDSLATCQMNSTDTINGAYVGSDYYTGNNGNTGKATAQSAVESAFGSSHILTHREYLQNSITGNYENGGAWYDSGVELMSERMVFGCDIMHNFMHGTHWAEMYGIDNSQLPLFAHNHSIINIYKVWWLRSVSGNNAFCSSNAYGCIVDGSASSTRAVRPAFGICKANPT